MQQTQRPNLNLKQPNRKLNTTQSQIDLYYEPTFTTRFFSTSNPNHSIDRNYPKSHLADSIPLLFWRSRPIHRLVFLQLPLPIKWKIDHKVYWNQLDRTTLVYHESRGTFSLRASGQRKGVCAARV